MLIYLSIFSSLFVTRHSSWIQRVTVCSDRFTFSVALLMGGSETWHRCQQAATNIGLETQKLAARWRWRLLMMTTAAPPPENNEANRLWKIVRFCFHDSRCKVSPLKMDEEVVGVVESGTGEEACTGQTTRQRRWTQLWGAGAQHKRGSRRWHE